MGTVMPPRAAALPLLGLLALLAAACAVRTQRERVFTEDRTEVLLRSETKGGTPIERGFDHPAVIASARIAHILSRIDIRTEVKKGSEKRPAIPVKTIYAIAEGVSQALAKANPNQEIVVLSINVEKRLGIFDRNYLTTFVAYLDEDLLHIHLSRVDDEIDVREKDIPQPKIGKHVMKFSVVPSEAMTSIDYQSVAISWRDRVFSRPTRLRILPGGRVVRRQILMESPEEEFPQPEPLPDHLSPSTLRRLADLEEMRRRGEISEGEYTARRNEMIRSDGAAPR